MKQTVSGNIGKFKANEVLRKQDSILAYYRAILNEDGPPCTLTDDEVWAIIVRHENEYDDEDREMFIVQEIQDALPK